MLSWLKNKANTLTINEAAAQAAQNPDITLLDVRTPGEYAQGHLPHSKLLPLDKIATIESLYPNKEAPFYVYCQSGGRSSQACRTLKKMGYTNAVNVGGIMSWRGTLATGK